MMIQKLAFLAGSIFAAMAVILGAFGAHKLKELITIDKLQVFETGVRYQFYHALALILCGLLIRKGMEPGLLNYSIYFFILGILFFSGSLFLLATNKLLDIENWKWLGPVTPIGGLFFITGWILMIWYFIKNTQEV